MFLRCEISVTKTFRTRCSTWHRSLKILYIAAITKRVDIIHPSTIHKQVHVCIWFFYHSTSILEHTLTFLKCMVNKLVFMNWLSLVKKIALTILRLGKIVKDLGISTIHIHWVIPNSLIRAHLPYISRKLVDALRCF